MERACTLVGGESGVWVDSSALAVANPEAVAPGNVEVCLDERCIPLYTVEHLGGGLGQDGFTSFKIDDSADSFSLVLRTLDGEVLAGPTEIEAGTIYPNGKGCDPELLVAKVTVRGDGTIEAP